MDAILKMVLIMSLALSLAACSSADPVTGAGSGGGSAPTNPSSPLELTVSTKYSASDSGSSPIGTCTIASGTLPTDAAANATCNIQIPELQMYYSDIEFTISTNSETTCSYISFVPFQFRRSNSATFRNDSDETDVDCSGGNPTDKYCYGGAAKFLLGLKDQYPKSEGLYFIPGANLRTTYTLPSSDTNRADDPHISVRKNNTNVANSFGVSPAATIAAGEVNYLGGSLTNYTFSCSDRWGETQYSWTLILGDDDTPGTAVSIDNFYDWGN